MIGYWFNIWTTSIAIGVGMIAFEHYYNKNKEDNNDVIIVKQSKGSSKKGRGKK